MQTRQRVAVTPTRLLAARQAYASKMQAHVAHLSVARGSAIAAAAAASGDGFMMPPASRSLCALLNREGRRFIVCTPEVYRSHGDTKAVSRRTALTVHRRDAPSRWSVR